MTLDVSEPKEAEVSAPAEATAPEPAAVAPVAKGKGIRIGLRARKRIFRLFIAAFFVVYVTITLTPFYVLFIRTFVGTKDSTTLHLTPPPEEPIAMEAGIGNLAVFYNLDLREFKKDFGIKGYLKPQMTLDEIAAEFEIPVDDIKSYFQPFSRYNGWLVLFRDGLIWPAAGRTLLVTVGSMLGMIVLGICTGFGLAGLRHRLHMAVYSLYLLEAVLPAMLILLPQFFIVQWIINLIPGTDTAGPTRFAVQLISLIVLNIRGGALATMIFTAAIGAIPSEMEDAAMVDGASRLEYLRYIVLPLMKVPIASLVVITLPGFWNQFLGPYIYLDPANSTLIPLIQAYSGTYTTNYQVVFTGVFVSILPLVLVYILFRRWFIEGVMSGAVKG